jgi:hypothetical protein
VPIANAFSGAKPTRTPETDRRYLKGGELLLARAKKATPDLDAVGALVTLFNNPKWTLSAATTRIYQQQVEAILDRELRNGTITEARASEGLAFVTRLLKKRRGRPPKRTSAKKRKEATYAEYKAILKELERKAKRTGGLDLCDGVLGKLILTGPYFGLRPVEWLNAQVTEHELIVRNAKHSNGRAPGAVRSIMLAHVPPSIVNNLDDLIEGIRQLAEQKDDWGKVLRVLGERLARLCKRLKIPRWSLYTVRHIAEATWKRAGLSAAQIAALSGHISIKTARNHYAGSRHGWSAKFACARPAPSLVSMIERHNSTSLAAQNPARDATVSDDVTEDNGIDILTDDETTNFSPR